MNRRTAAIALGVGTATAAGLYLLKVDKPVLIGSTAVVFSATLLANHQRKKIIALSNAPYIFKCSPDKEKEIKEANFSYEKVEDFEGDQTILITRLISERIEKKLYRPGVKDTNKLLSKLIGLGEGWAYDERTISGAQLPEGKYWVGDLSLIYDESTWEEITNQCFKKRGKIDLTSDKGGVFYHDDGYLFAVFKTKCGDGIFKDNEGNEYATDSGSIGCVPFRIIKEIPNSGVSLKFSSDFFCDFHQESGTIRLGNIQINTDPYSQDVDNVLDLENQNITSTSYNLTKGTIVRLINLAADESKKNNHKGVIHYTNQVLDIDPEDTDALMGRAQAKFYLGDVQGSISDFKKLLEIDPNNSYYFYCRGRLKYESDDLKGACEDWKKAAELGDEDAAELLKEHCE